MASRVGRRLVTAQDVDTQRSHQAAEEQIKCELASGGFDQVMVD